MAGGVCERRFMFYRKSLPCVIDLRGNYYSAAAHDKQELKGNALMEF